jgi:hypothetical protein
MTARKCEWRSAGIVMTRRDLKTDVYIYICMFTKAFKNATSVNTLTSKLRTMSTYNLLLSGYRDTYSYVSFEPSTAKIKVIKDTPAPKKAAWLEPSLTKKGTYFSISEEDGLAFSLGLEEDGTVKTGGERKTNGGPAHSTLIPLLHCCLVELTGCSSRYEGWIWYRRCQCQFDSPFV